MQTPLSCSHGFKSWCSENLHQVLHKLEQRKVIFYFRCCKKDSPGCANKTAENHLQWHRNLLKIKHPLSTRERLSTQIHHSPPSPNNWLTRKHIVTVCRALPSSNLSNIPILIQSNWLLSQLKRSNTLEMSALPDCWRNRRDVSLLMSVV